ncbi:MAG: 30S ribosomal protein S16 [Patescibacteria group bacterium]
MLVIRLRRIGKKNKPSYRIVVAEHTNPVSGKVVADLGFYNPHTKKIGLLAEPAKEWLDKGAQPSNTVAKILTKEKVKHNLIVVKTKNRPAKKKETVQPTKPSPKLAESTQDEAPTPEATAKEEAAPLSDQTESAEPSTEQENSPQIEDSTSAPSEPSDRTPDELHSVDKKLDS